MIGLKVMFVSFGKLVPLFLPTRRVFVCLSGYKLSCRGQSKNYETHYFSVLISQCYDTV
jgi:hypothetical protein